MYLPLNIHNHQVNSGITWQIKVKPSKLQIVSKVTLDYFAFATVNNS